MSFSTPSTPKSQNSLSPRMRSLRSPRAGSQVLADPPVVLASPRMDTPRGRFQTFEDIVARSRPLPRVSGKSPVVIVVKQMEQLTVQTAAFADEVYAFGIMGFNVVHSPPRKQCDGPSPRFLLLSSAAGKVIAIDLVTTKFLDRPLTWLPLRLREALADIRVVVVGHDVMRNTAEMGAGLLFTSRVDTKVIMQRRLYYQQKEETLVGRRRGIGAASMILHGYDFQPFANLREYVKVWGTPPEHFPWGHEAWLERRTPGAIFAFADDATLEYWRAFLHAYGMVPIGLYSNEILRKFERYEQLPVAVAVTRLGADVAEDTPAAVPEDWELAALEQLGPIKRGGGKAVPALGIAHQAGDRALTGVPGFAEDQDPRPRPSASPDQVKLIDGPVFKDEREKHARNIALQNAYKMKSKLTKHVVPGVPSDAAYYYLYRSDHQSGSIFTHAGICPQCSRTAHLAGHCQDAAGQRLRCYYPRCNDQYSHHTPVCPTLHHRCSNCWHRGHRSVACPAGQPLKMSRHYEDFLRFRSTGVGTRHSNGNVGWDFFPVPPWVRHSLLNTLSDDLPAQLKTPCEPPRLSFITSGEDVYLGLVDAIAKTCQADGVSVAAAERAGCFGGVRTVVAALEEFWQVLLKHPHAAVPSYVARPLYLKPGARMPLLPEDLITLQDARFDCMTTSTQRSSSLASLESLRAFNVGEGSSANTTSTDWNEMIEEDKPHTPSQSPAHKKKGSVHFGPPPDLVDTTVSPHQK